MGKSTLLALGLAILLVGASAQAPVPAPAPAPAQRTTPAAPAPAPKATPPAQAPVVNPAQVNGPVGVPGPSVAPGVPGTNTSTTGTPGAPGAPGPAGTPGATTVIYVPSTAPGAVTNVTNVTTTTSISSCNGNGNCSPSNTTVVVQPSTPGSSGANGTNGTPGTPGTPGVNTTTIVYVPTPPLPQQTPSPSPPPPANTPLPPPPPPAQCVVEPTCRLYVEDMQCCQNEGLLTDKSAAFVWLLCTHSVSVAEGCMSVTGPINNTVTPVFNGPSGYNFRHVVDWSATYNSDGTHYTGPVTLDYQNQRTNSSCSLNIDPCILNGQTYTSVSVVKDLPFNTLSFTNFFDGYVGCPATNIDYLDSWGWINPGNSTACYEQKTSSLPATFWQGGWVYYNQGVQIPCNATATQLSLQNYQYSGPSSTAGR